MSEYKQVYLHVGLPKTATTYLQLHLFKELEDVQLLGKHTNLSPSAFPNLKALEELLMYGNPIFSDFDELTREVQRELLSIKKNKLLFTREGFSGSVSDNFRSSHGMTMLLKGFFPEAKIIFIFRRQADWLDSIYKQMLRVGANINVNDFLNYRRGQFRDAIPPLPLGVSVRDLDWSRMVDYYSKHFGSGCVLALPYEMILDDTCEFVKRIADFIEVPVPGKLQLSRKSNTSDALLAYRMYRMLNMVVDKERRLGANRFLGRLVSRCCKSGNYFPNKIRKEIFDLHSESNSSLANKVGIDLAKFGYF